MMQSTRPSRVKGSGCLALIGIVLMGVGIMVAVVGVAAQSGLLRSDPAGLVLLAAAVGLVGLLVFVAASRMR